jgi:hypothetical protein
VEALSELGIKPDGWPDPAIWGKEAILAPLGLIQ